MQPNLFQFLHIISSTPEFVKQTPANARVCLKGVYIIILQVRIIMEDSIYLDLGFCGNGQLPEQPLQEPPQPAQPPPCLCRRHICHKIRPALPKTKTPTTTVPIQSPPILIGNINFQKRSEFCSDWPLVLGATTAREKRPATPS